MAKIKAQETTNVDKDVEKKEPLCTVGGNANWCNHSGKQYGGSQKIKNRGVSGWPSRLSVRLLVLALVVISGSRD